VNQADQPDVIGRRIGAGLLDVVALGLIFVGLGLALGEGETGDGTASITLEGAEALLYFALVLLYYFAGELAIGRTPGKALLGLRVVRRDGERAGAGRIALRTLLRAVDVLPFLYLLGFVLMLATGRRRARLGDLAAGTAVVRG
jgi:uncharacterized RDD family membrane protein YckC